MRKKLILIGLYLFIFIFILAFSGIAQVNETLTTKREPTGNNGPKLKEPLNTKQESDNIKQGTNDKKSIVSEPVDSKTETQNKTFSEDKNTHRLSLQECIEIALKNNHTRPISQLSLEIAESQHREALSSYWPSVKLNSTLTQLDQDVTNITPEETLNSVSTSTIINTIPPLGLNGAILKTNVVSDVEETRRTIKGKTNIDTSVLLTYPIYTGGIRPAIIRQAQAGVDAAKQEIRRTDLQVIYDCKRMYYGAVLAKELVKIGKNALAQLKATLDLSETMYKGGSGKVKKTDYLRNKIAVNALRSMVVFLETNEIMAKSALIFNMGLNWDTPIELLDEDIPFNPYEADLKNLISNSYEFNPDFGKLRAGLDAAEAKIRESRGGYLPKVACFGSIMRTDNSYKYGITNKQNNRMWAVGVGVEVPIFDGFLTQNRIREARAHLKKLQEQKILLEEGLALQVKYIFLKILSLQNQEKSSKEAADTAEENCQLNTRAYQDDLVETKDVIEAQLVESFMKAQYLKTLYDHIEAQAYLDAVIGEQVNKLILTNKLR